MISLNNPTSLPAPQFDCPTIQNLNVIDVSSIDNMSPHEQANKWLSAFKATVSSEDIDSLLSLFHQYGFWKDILALTWDRRTIRGHVPIRCMLDARLANTGLSVLHLLEDAIRGPKIVKPFPDLVFLRFCFEFETTHGKGIAVAFLVPTCDGTWTAWSLFARLHGLNAYPEKIGALRDPPSTALHESWESRRQHEIEFSDMDPTVLVIGAGHNGLAVAARLTYLGVPTLVVERNKRVGDNWRMRYNKLSLLNTVWNDQMPYLPFPSAWPVHTPAAKLADWLECYATSLDLNVWLSSSVSSAAFNHDTRSWLVTINRAGQTRTMIVKHLVFATGFGCPKTPDISRKELFRGSILHSTEYRSAEDYEGKKVIIVGVGNSGHDIAHDFCHHGWDVTMIQRSSICVTSQKALSLSFEATILCGTVETYNETFPIEFADVLGAALPFATAKCLLKLSAERIANGIDKELLENLETAGFRTYLGPDGSGPIPVILGRAGGAYVDIGVSQKIIDGSIKVKGSLGLRFFTQEGIELEDDTMLEGDVVVFATGFGDLHDSIEEVCGPDVAAKVGKIWGLDAEGELQGVFRWTGHPRLWIALENLGRSRFFSLHLALQIKAIEEGIVSDEIIYTR